MKQKDMIATLIDELERLRKSHELLEKLFSEIGPYRDGEISDQTWVKIKSHLEFDDSE